MPTPNQYAVAVRLQQAAIEQAKALQGISQSDQSFPLEQQNRALGAQRLSQQIGQSNQSFPMEQQKLGLGNQQALQTLLQGSASFRSQQQAAMLAQETDLAKQYNAEPGEILNTLAHRNLTRDQNTQQLREAQPGEPVWAKNALSFAVEPKFVPGQNGLPGTTTPGRFGIIPEQDAHSLLDSANARLQMQREAQSQMAQPDTQSAVAAPMAQSAPRNTGWGIFGNEGNAGDYQTKYLQDEANVAGLSPQQYLQSIVNKQMGSGAAAPATAQPGGFQMPQDPHSEFATLSASRPASLGGPQPQSPGTPQQQSDWVNSAFSAAAPSQFQAYLQAQANPSQQAPPSTAAQTLAWRNQALASSASGASDALDGVYHGARQAVIRGGNVLGGIGNGAIGLAGGTDDYFQPTTPTPSTLPNPLTWMLHRMGIGQ